MDRGWPHNFERKIAIRSKTDRRKAALLKKKKKQGRKRNIAFRDTINEALMKKCNLIQNQALPCQLVVFRSDFAFTEKPLIFLTR